MKSIVEVSNALKQALQRKGTTQEELRKQAGVSQRTLTNVLSGQEDYRLSTLLALADRVGLELVLVPKGAAAVVQAGETVPLRVLSRVTAALGKTRQGV